MTLLEPTPIHPIVARLREVGILKAAIIDDAFDPLRAADLVAEIGEFWGAIDRNERQLAELRSISTAIIDGSDITDQHLTELWERRDALPELAEPLKEFLFAQRLLDLAPLWRLEEHLKAADITPVSVGSEAELTEPFRLIFLDWLLRPDDAGKASRARAKTLYREHTRVEDKPFIVLMSSRPDDAFADTADFRKASSLIGGLFGFVAKDELSDRNQLFMYLTAWSTHLPARHQIQHFVEGLELGLDRAKTKFVEQIRGLRFEDYANIQSLCLHDDGHPLGEYMLWLYSSLLTHLLQEDPAVQAQRKLLDTMKYKEFVPVEEHPSPELAQIYQCALTDPAVAEVGSHPRAAEGNGDPYLQLGDLFFMDSGELDVVMVANAACDLAYSPGEARPFRPRQPILLLQGRLQPYHAETEDAEDARNVRTELINHDDQPHRIIWNPGHLQTCEYGTVKDWLEQRTYRRRGRLSLPYALQIQQAFAARMTRVGMPVRPPICGRGADVEIWFKGPDGASCRAGEPVAGGAVILKRNAGDQFVITLPCARAVVDRLRLVVAQAEAETAGCRAAVAAAGSQLSAVKVAAGKLTGAENRLTKLLGLLDPSMEWLAAARRPTLLPPADSATRAEVKRGVLEAYLNHKFEAAYAPNIPIVLNLVVKDERSSVED